MAAKGGRMAGSFNIRGGRKWKAVLDRLAVKAEVRAGILEGAKNTEGEYVAQYAAYNEYGTPTIRERPFMRTTIER